MKTFNVPVREQVSPEAQIIFDQIQKRVGKVPNLYAAIGYSANALKGMLEYENTLGHGVFSAKEQEAIFLVVSEVNGCNYCLAAHSLSAIKKGFTQAETLDLRRGEIADGRLNAIIQLAKSITINKGNADDTLLANFYAAGFDEAAVIELIGLVTARTFTNYVFALTKIPVDFPAAQPLN